MSNYVSSHFGLYGNFDPRDVPLALSLEPSSTMEKGEPLEVMSEVMPSRIADWDLYGPEQMSLNEQLEFLVSTLWSRADIIRKLTSEHRGDIVISFAQDEANAITLKPDALRKLADLNITLNCFSMKDEVEGGD